MKRILNFTSDDALIRSINAGDFINLDVVSNDVKNAKILFGPALPEIRGKATNRKPMADQPEEIPEFIPALSGEVIAYVDIAFIAKQKFMVMVVPKLSNWLDFAPISAKTTSSLIYAVARMVGFLFAKQLRVSTIISDRESALTAQDAIMALQGKAIDTRFSGASSKVGIIERALRTLKEISRCIVLSLDFPIFLALIPHIIEAAKQTINARRTQANNYGPPAFQHIYGRKMNARIDMRLRFGEYVQLSQAASTDAIFAKITRPRTVGAIALEATYNGNGTWVFLQINSKKICHRNNFVRLKLPEIARNELIRFSELPNQKVLDKDMEIKYHGDIIEYNAPVNDTVDGFGAHV